MRLHEVTRSWHDGQVRLTGRVTQDAEPREFEIYFSFPEDASDLLRESADPFAIAMLIPAMYRHESLHIDPPISPLLARRLPRIRDIWWSWRQELERVDLYLNPAPASLPTGDPRAAAFFSNGVDSLLTALKRSRFAPGAEPLTHLLFMRGIETPLAQIRGFESSLNGVRAAGQALGVATVHGETNLRTFFDRHWERYYCGSGLAAVATALGGFRVAYIPSSSSYKAPLWTGSNNLTDEMFSTEYTEILVDGAEYSRAAKIQQITAWAPDLVRRHLRVCIANEGGDWNCGKCHKCARTSVVLALLNQLPDAGMFREHPRAYWARVLPQDWLDFNREAQAMAQAIGGHPALERMLGRIIRRRHRRDALLTLAQNSPFQAALPMLRGVRDRLGIRPRER